jgi:hypothetical protein
MFHYERRRLIALSDDPAAAMDIIARDTVEALRAPARRR